jgi:predicted TPR repeat methyltransferase
VGGVSPTIYMNGISLDVIQLKIYAGSAHNRSLQLEALSICDQELGMSSKNESGSRLRILQARDQIRGWVKRRRQQAEELTYRVLKSNNKSARTNNVLLEGVASAFDQFSESYDDKMSHSNYTAPQLLFDAMQEFLPGIPNRLAILDAGCGTGLCSGLFRPLAHRLDGVDVSCGMIEKARQRGLYDHLETLDLISYLTKSSTTYDLIISAGVFQFFSNMETLFAGANKVLRNGGYLSFTVDKLDAEGRKYEVSPRANSMYLHHPDYICSVATATDFAIVKSREIIDRNDMIQNKPVPGILYVLQKSRPV